MQYGTARFIINNGGRYSLSYADPYTMCILEDWLYKGEIVYNSLTTEYFFSSPDSTDLSGLLVPFNINIMSIESVKSYLRINTIMLELSEWVFELNPESNIEGIWYIPQRTITIA